jgi:hypothetical protein
VAYIAILSMNVSGMPEEKHENFLRIGGVPAGVLRLGASGVHPNCRGISCHWPCECEHFGGSGFSCKQFTAFARPSSAGCKWVSVPVFSAVLDIVYQTAPCRILEGYNIRVLETRLAGDNISIVSRQCYSYEGLRVEQSHLFNISVV